MQVLRRIVPVLSLAVMGLALVASPALAGNGKIAGTITDESGQTLVGASVSTDVGGVRVGTTTDQTGRYFILNVPPGSYVVQASYVGHQTVRKTEVNVRLDLTTSLDYTLRTEAIQGRTVTVVAEAPAIERTLTSSRQSISADELNNTMPVSDIQDLVNTTAGAFRGFIRGGRKADTKVLVDGIDVSDTYFRAGEGRGVYSSYTATQRSSGDEFTSVGINQSTVQALDVISGTFNAEYDAATAGIINVVTKEGGGELDVSVFYRVAPGTKNAGPDVYDNPYTDAGGTAIDGVLDRYIAERDALLNATTTVDGAVVPDDAKVTQGQLYTFDSGRIDEVGYGDDLGHELEIAVSGPLTSNGGFFVSTRFSDQPGTMPNVDNRNLRHTAKLTYNVSNSMKLTGSLMIDDGGLYGGFVNRDFNSKYIFYPEGAIGNKKGGLMGYIGLTHTVSDRTVVEVKLSQLNRTSEFGFSDDNNDGRIGIDEDGDFVQIKTAAQSELYLGVGGSAVAPDGSRTFFTADPGNEKYFNVAFAANQYRTGQPGFYYEELKRNVTQLKADVTHQYNFNHQLKAGLLLRNHSVEQWQQRTQVKVIYDPQFPFENTQYDVSPRELAFYVQDKVEYEGVIINAGLRIDSFDPGAQQLEDYFNPSRQDTMSNGQIVRRARLGDDAETKWFIQPRLGISHPISETAAMHYSWGRFYTPPPFSNLYDEYGTFANPSLPNIVDVNADPPEATAYEMGLQWGFHPDYLLDVTAYYRDIENYGRLGYSISPDQSNNPGFGSYGFVTSFGYADSRGIEVSLMRRPGKTISGRVNYAYSYVKAGGRAGGNLTPFPDKTSYSAAGGDTEVPFDAGDQFNTVERNVGGSSSSLTSGYDRTHQLSISLLAQLPAGIDLSLIQSVESGFQYTLVETSTDPRDRQTRRAPMNAQTDLRATRGLALGGVNTGLFVEVTNLLDRENILAYDNSTIPNKVRWEEDEEPNGELNRSFNANGVSFYGPPRQVSLGLSLDF